MTPHVAELGTDAFRHMEVFHFYNYFYHKHLHIVLSVACLLQLTNRALSVILKAIYGQEDGHKADS